MVLRIVSGSSTMPSDSSSRFSRPSFFRMPISSAMVMYRVTVWWEPMRQMAQSVSSATEARPAGLANLARMIIRNLASTGRSMLERVAKRTTWGSPWGTLGGT